MASFALLRAPLLPVQALSAPADAAFRSAIVRAAGHASPSFARALSTPTSTEATDAVIRRYRARMAGRSTPFDLFAGASMVPFAHEPQLLLGDVAGATAHARLDARLVRRLVRKSPSDSLFVVNPTLYEASPWLRAYDEDEDGYCLVSLRVDRSVSSFLLGELHGSPRSRLEWARELAASQGCELDEATAAVDTFAARSVFRLAFDVSVVGGPGRMLLDAVGAGLPADVMRIVGDGERFDVETRLDSLEAQLRTRACEVDHPPREPVLAVDVRLPASRPLALPNSARSLVALAARTLARLDAGTRPAMLGDFAKAFEERFEDAEVPLLLALDPDHGVGERMMGSVSLPLVRGLHFGEPARSTSARRPVDVALLGLYHHAIASGEHAIDLDRSFLDSHHPVADRPERSSALLAVLMGDIARPGSLRIWAQTLVAGGASLLARFALGDGELTAALRDHIEETEDDDAVYAEIVHTPRDLVHANVSTRPSLRRTEIHLTGTPPRGEVSVLPLADLMVSVRDGSVVLRSRRDGRRVIPRLSSAHNFALPNQLLPYRFLARLAIPDKSRGRMFHWPPALARAPYLPEVRHDRVLLRPATWNLTPLELQAFSRKVGIERVDAVRAWLEARRVHTRWATLDRRNAEPLLCDLADAESLALLAHELGAVRSKGTDKNREVALVDAPDVREPLVRGPRGDHRHEIIVPVHFPRTTPRRATSRGVAAVKHMPTGEWLYAKVYASEGELDRMLARYGSKLLRLGTERGVTSSFFIRYWDPAPHVRLRFRLSRPEEFGAIMGALGDLIRRALPGGLCHRWQFDTYVPETLRYGGEAGISLAHACFAADSAAAAVLVRATEPASKERWLAAAYSVHHLLEALGFDVQERIGLLTNLLDGLVARSGEPAPRFRAKVASRLAETRADFANVVSASPPPPPFAVPLARRAKALSTVSVELRALARRGRLATPLDDVAKSLVHMCTNRIVASAFNAQEMVLYDGLARAYRSVLARRNLASERKGVDG